MNKIKKLSQIIVLFMMVFGALQPRFMQGSASSTVNSFMSPVGIPIAGTQKWKGWNGTYFPHKKAAFLKNSSTKEVIHFIHVNTDSSHKLSDEFATMPPNPNQYNENLFSNSLTLFSPYAPRPILFGKEVSPKAR